jgi:hypothetical protein
LTLTPFVRFRKNNGQIEFYNGGVPDWGKWVPVTTKTIFLSQGEGGLKRFNRLNYAGIDEKSGEIISFDIDFKPFDSTACLPKFAPGGLYKLMNGEY